MEVSKEELLHIAELSNIKLQEEEIPEYLKNLQDILNFADIVNSVNTDNLSETIGSTSNVNMPHRLSIISIIRILIFLRIEKIN